MTDVIKEAAQYLRNSLETEYEKKVRSSHAHAAVAGFLGYKSKKALLADNDNYPVEDEHILLHRETSEQALSDSISRMQDTPLKDVPVQLVSTLIETGLTPSCEQCGEKTLNSSPVYTEDCDDDPDGQVCNRCSSFHDDEYATCIYCGPGVIYRADQINTAGECPEHSGESYMDDEERQGWEDYIENITKDI